MVMQIKLIVVVVDSISYERAPLFSGNLLRVCLVFFFSDFESCKCPLSGPADHNIEHSDPRAFPGDISEGYMNT